MICPYCKKELPVKQNRTRPQLKYYWSLIIKILSNELSYTPNEMHEILKTLFLSQVVLLESKKGIKEIRVSRATGDCTTTEIETYYSKIREWASLNFGIYIPNPNEPIIEIN